MSLLAPRQIYCEGMSYVFLIRGNFTSFGAFVHIDEDISTRKHMGIARRTAVPQSYSALILSCTCYLHWKKNMTKQLLYVPIQKLKAF